MNGAELMDQIERTSGAWRPSPGSLYPLLEAMTAEGVVRKRPDGRYEVTEKGRDSMTMPWDIFGMRPTTVEGLITDMASTVAYFEDLQTSSPAKLEAHREFLRSLGQRLEKLGPT